MLTVKKGLIIVLISFIAGMVNAVFGTGAGMVYILLLGGLFKSKGERDIFASVSFAVLGLCIVSDVVYAIRGNFSIKNSWYYAIAGGIGGTIGALLLNVIKPRYLKMLLALFLIYAGIRMILK